MISKSSHCRCRCRNPSLCLAQTTSETDGSGAHEQANEGETKTTSVWVCRVSEAIELIISFLFLSAELISCVLCALRELWAVSSAHLIVNKCFTKDTKSIKEKKNMVNLHIVNVFVCVWICLSVCRFYLLLAYLGRFRAPKWGQPGPRADGEWRKNESQTARYCHRCRRRHHQLVRMRQPPK